MRGGLTLPGKKKESRLAVVGEELPPEQLESIQADLKGSPLIEDMFSQTITEDDILDEEDRQRSEAENSAKELFSPLNIETKTELSLNKIGAASRMDWISKTYGIPAYGIFLQTYMQLMVSHKRQGRKEFIQAKHAEERRMGGGEEGPMARFMGMFRSGDER